MEWIQTVLKRKLLSLFPIFLCSTLAWATPVTVNLQGVLESASGTLHAGDSYSLAVTYDDSWVSTTNPTYPYADYAGNAQWVGTVGSQAVNSILFTSIQVQVHGSYDYIRFSTGPTPSFYFYGQTPTETIGVPALTNAPMVLNLVNYSFFSTSFPVGGGTDYNFQLSASVPEPSLKSLCLHL